MDGTTAGRLGIVIPAPRPTAPIGGNMLRVYHTALDPGPSLVTAPALPQPVSEPLPLPAPVVQPPQFSQLTPVYAPTPTNTPADIPQPAVKGIEFVQSPTLLPTPQVNRVLPPSPPPTIEQVMPPLATQSIQPILSPVTQPQQPPVILTVPSSIMPPASVAIPTMSPIVNTPSVEYYGDIEEHLADLDLDQTVGAVASTEQKSVVKQETAAVASGPAPIPPPVTKLEIAQNYFQNSSKIVSDVPIDAPGFSIKNLNPKLIRMILIIVVIIILVVGGYFVVNVVIGGQKSRQTTPVKVSSQTTTVPQPDFTQTASTTTTASTAAPATTSTATATPATSSAVPTVANTAVSDAYAGLPKYLNISKLSIHAPVEQVGVTKNGAMGVPTNIWNAGWYTGSARPGQTGAAFIDGHSSSSGGALFGKLDKLKVGDSITVERNDGIVVTYSVAKISIVNRNYVDMASMLKPYDSHKNGLNIMSCIGSWIASESTLENRILVYAVQT